MNKWEEMFLFFNWIFVTLEWMFILYEVDFSIIRFISRLKIYLSMSCHVHVFDRNKTNMKVDFPIWIMLICILYISQSYFIILLFIYPIFMSWVFPWGIFWDKVLPQEKKIFLIINTLKVFLIINLIISTRIKWLENHFSSTL